MTNEIEIDEALFDDDSDILENDLKIDPIANRTISIKKYDRMIEDIINSIKNGKIILDPEYQRNYIWDNKRASKLVESILLKIPIPVIYASETEDSKWNVIDGLQRLHGLERFYNDDFKLTGLEVLSELNGKKYSDLDEKIKRMIDSGDLTIILLLKETTPEIQYDVFMRLNSGSIKLNEQELRNCLYRGSLNQYVKQTLINNVEFMLLFGWKENAKRMQDVEVVLRYLAFSEYYDKKTGEMQEYDGRIKNLINLFMKKYQNTNLETLEKMGNKFVQSITKCHEIFGTTAFKKINSKTGYDTKINRPLYDTIMVAFEEYTLEQLKSKRDIIINKTETLIKSVEFNENISVATGNTTKINKRFKAYREMLLSIYNDTIE